MTQGWLDDCCDHFSSIKVLNEKYCVLFAFFEPSFCTMFLIASSCDIWKKQGCPDDFKFEFSI